MAPGESFFARAAPVFTVADALGRGGGLSRHAARAVYQEVLTRYPGDLEMQSGVGWCELRRGHRDEAAAAFRAVLAVSPDDASATAGLTAATAR